MWFLVSTPIGTPERVMSPEVGFTRPAIIFIKVVLPLPLEPSRAYILPGMKSMETPLTAVIFIYFLVTLLHCSIIKSLHILFMIIVNEINNLLFRKAKACHS